MLKFIRTCINRLHGTVRYKLLALVLFPILLVMPAALAFAIYWGKNFSYEQLFIKVNTDLSVANDVFTRIQKDYLLQVGQLAESFRFRSHLSEGRSYAVKDMLQALHEHGKFSFLHLIDNQRRWLHEDITPDTDPRSLRSDLVQRAFNGTPGYGIEVFDREALQREALADRVLLPLVDTPRAVPTQRKVEDRGMMIRVAYPVRDSRGDVVAVLDGGVLLNGNFSLVDTIRDLVYGAGSLPENSIGTVTVFLDDVRISTNVPHGPTERALGTRVSSQVRDHVLEQGKTWIDRAFVVNDWYISSYEPIHNVHGKRIGMLYAGFLERPFRTELLRALWILIGLFLVLMTLTAILAIQGAKTIFRPLESMTRVVAETRKGGDSRIGPVPSVDEIGELSREFDKMLDLLQQRNQEIQLAADQLELKVEERTEELSTRNKELSNTIRLLRQTRTALVEAEKLAALGELTAGVAHEINNPLAVMLGNMDIIIEELDAHLDPVRAETSLITEQIYRIKDIVNNLLQYARPADYAGYVTQVDVNQLLTDTLKLIQHLIKGSKVRLEFDLTATSTIEINPQELQQVLVNLLVNAIHAVEEAGGTISVKTADWDDLGLVITVADDGVGIPTEELGKVFNPFFTTKDQQQGTGLGLSISYGLIRRYGGRISVRSRPDLGTEFTVRLLRVPEFREDEETIAEQLASMS